MVRWLVVLFGLVVLAPLARPAEPSAAARGKKNLLGRSFNPGAWSLAAYTHLGRQWPEHSPQSAPPDAAAVLEHYGLHPAPYPNEDLPMGLRRVRSFLGNRLANDCLLCHGGSIAGHSYVGLGNASLDLQGLFEDLATADGRSARLPFRFANVRGTSEAGAVAVFLLSLREPDLTVRSSLLDLGFRDDLCEDVPAWWLLKKKKTMYHTGSSDARSVRSLMQFMLSPLNPPSVFAREEAVFTDIQAYLLSLQPPRYPFPVNTILAQQGEQVFGAHCARCHGTYGPNWTYPNKIVPIEVIGTDRTRFEGFTEASGRHYNRSWFAQEKQGWLADDFPTRPSVGYQAPPLDGIWATAPYFHHGAVPTVYHVLNSKVRPKYFTRSFRTEAAAYDPEKLGWKVEVLQRGLEVKLPARKRRQVYDTTLPGRGNGGHTFGDDLSEADRMAVIEYLKTL